MGSANKNSIQLSFINKIKEIVPPNYSLVDELSDLLQVSMDSAYRRIRGETALTIDEVKLLCDHYKISFDSFSSGDSDSVTFKYKTSNNEENFINDYLKSILDDLKKIQRVENKQIIYAAEDIPIFHVFKFHELSAFKMFYWLKSVINEPSLEGKKFEPSLIKNEIHEIGKQLFEIYTSIPSIEIWTNDTINSTLKQIEYYWESGLFENKEDVLTICNQFMELLLFIQKQAELSSKFITEAKSAENKDNYKFYHSEIEIANNCILASVGNTKAIYLTHQTFNKIVTVNAKFCHETEQWLNNLIKKSILISGVSEKQRFQFFRKALERIDALKNTIN